MSGSNQPPLTRIRNFRRNLLHWFYINGRCFPWRSPGQSEYQLVIAEVLLQRTRAETVSSIYPRFFKAYPSWSQLAAADLGELQDILRPLGLWRRRAFILKALAQSIHKNQERVPKSRAEIERLPGVGQYIANAIELVCGTSPSPLIDVNMSRVLERYFGPRTKVDLRYDPYLQRLAWRVSDCSDSVDLNWAILDLAALICTAKAPMCYNCPLKVGCNYSRGITKAREDYAN